MKHKLKPFNDKEEKACSHSRVHFFDGKKFLECMRCDHMYFSIIPKDSKEEVDEVPT